MTTPQQALELAEIEAGTARLMRINCHEDLAIQAEHKAAILRHYAEIMQAEAFAEIDEDGDLSIANSWCGNVKAVAVNAQLIIKPKPLS